MTKEIQLTQGQVAKISDHRFDELNQYKWNAHWDKKGHCYYAMRNNGRIQMHNVIANTPKGMECDHINHDTLDNRDENLRNVTHSQNMTNQRTHSGTRLGERCITPNRNGFQVTIKKDKKIVFNKWFKNLSVAMTNRDEAIKKFHGEFAYLPELEQS